MLLATASARAQDAASAAAVTYSTNFDLTELPLSERGAWHHNGLDWSVVESGKGLAYGTQTGSAGFNDSYAFLSGFPANQSASGVISKSASIDGSCTHEVEILLRWSDAAHSATGYECNVAFDGSYAEIVRWNGPLGNFTYLTRSKVPAGIKDGDKVSATMVGEDISLSVNGTEVAHAKDATYAAGNPGIGFWRGGPCGTKGDYAFTSFSATSSVSTGGAPVPIGKHVWQFGALLSLGMVVVASRALGHARGKKSAFATRAVGP